MVRSDNPIVSQQDDLLGRAPMARVFAEHCLAFDVSKGLVIGVLGPWGAGKTSFMNLARQELEARNHEVLEFNPWMFSGSDQLVARFFAELSAQLRVKRDARDIADSVAEYGATLSGMAWIPVVGPWLDRGRVLAQLVVSALRRQPGGIPHRRIKLEDALRKRPRPIVVVVDDVDRLTCPEIRDVFKLVRLTGSFPNIIYVVAFDRARVEQALTEDGVPGRDYLEKILQYSLDLPEIQPEVLHRLTLSGIEEALEGIETPGPFDHGQWTDVFIEIVRPLVRSVRDVRRYSAAVRAAVIALDGRVALVDALALEAVRVFLPDVFALLHCSIDALTQPPGDRLNIDDNENELKKRVELLLNASGEHRRLVADLIRRLFPVGNRHLGGSGYGSDWHPRWLSERRVAHKDVLRLYLERSESDGLRDFVRAERAFELMHDQDAFDGYLRAIPIDRQEDVIAALETFEEKYRPEMVVPATTALLNILSDLPPRPTNMVGLDTPTVVRRVVLRLLRSLEDASLVERAARDALPRIRTLTSKLELLELVGHREGGGYKLITEAAAAQLEREWRDEVRGSPCGFLVEEKDLLGVLLRLRRDSAADEPPFEVEPCPDLTIALVRCARTEAISLAFGTRATQRTPRLFWKALVEAVGDEESLALRLNSLPTGPDTEDDEAIALARRYLSGWRPDRFGDD